VTIADGAIIAAGSVITESVPEDALALGRARQVTKKGRAATWRAARLAAKEKAAKPVAAAKRKAKAKRKKR